MNDLKLDYGVLACPACGDTYLHHDFIEVFERTEDADRGLHISVLGVDAAPESEEGGAVLRTPSTTVDHSMDGNPSARRQGIAVWFWCECCRKRSRLTIVQHKGNTYLEHMTADEMKARDDLREKTRGMSAAQRVRYLHELQEKD